MKKTFRKLAEQIHRTEPAASFSIEFWDGDSITFGKTPTVTLKLNTKQAAKRIIGNGYLGFGESYMSGDLQVKGNLQELLRLGLSIDFNKNRLPFWQIVRFTALSILNRDTFRRTPKNIAYHYDRGNDFYELYLDNTMTYSCAYFKNPHDTLERAQLNKYEHICRKLMLQPGDSLLDVGCGWGGMLIYAAQNYGISGIGNTLSKNQYEYANNKIRELGLENRIKVLYKDYRELNGVFDKFVSIGMFEHVGKKFIPVFMEKVTQLLKPAGVGLLHTIGKDSPSRGDPWTLKYIFPGGYIPVLSETVEAMGKAGFSVLDVENLRMHYAKTLDLWAANFEQHSEKVKEMFDESFERRWRLFLNGASAGFKYSDTRLFQVLFSNGINNELPITRQHVYSEHRTIPEPV